jgi:TAT-translocated FGD2 family F420-dependent dehydrogenase
MASVGFVLSDEQFSPIELVEWGVAAEQAGFDMVWCSDHFHPWQDNQGHSGLAWITLAALGQRQNRIPMGTGVTCPTYRYNPAIVAQGFATLATLYPGRIFLGVGSGEAVNELPTTGQWHEYEARSKRLVEAVTLIRHLWQGNWVDFRGDYYQVQEAKLYDPPPQMIPIYIAASGPESMRLAGHYGDGLVTGAENLDKEESMNAFREGAEKAGKDVDHLPITVEAWAFVGSKADAQKAAEKWRFAPKASEKFVDNPDPRDIQKQATAKVSIEEATKGWAIGDDPNLHIAALQKLIDGGATNIFVHSPQEDQGRMIDFYGEHVLPNIDHQVMQPSSTVQETAHAH